MVELIVLYPQPKDVDRFEEDYDRHLEVLHEKTGIPAGEKPYTVTRFLPGPDGDPPYYQMFAMPFPSTEALQATMASSGMQEVAADANRISTGGAPTILVGAAR
ncbi:uncharacterized protein (TIGR02118 family) [Lewinella marina]|uniref:Ethyl tert-butyl ether degradation protein EthD n=1 Tax=Neolewinella marina TaxID=438751 RepID=A0A2G0CKJ3_9BACT|nr:EthD family reductase [Neolewinella marina]NJB84350.1 uncharacterized protein (TIGR02118 family) [Neolewinella marina]PHL00451.1 ethyl tert-butyl ether degradation protein EthD [Neolewinella marina]